MKRSEMLFTIKQCLMINSNDNKKDLSEVLLNIIETSGMLPPLTALELKEKGKVVGADTGHYWDNETD